MTQADVEFQHEERHLEDVVEGFDKDIKDRERRASRPQMHAFTGSSNASTEMSADMLAKVRAARNEPFFGRMDYSVGENGEVRTLYFGKSGINIKDVPQGMIFNWEAPIAALYFLPNQGFYEGPNGRIEAKVHLKRELEIADASLLSLQDILRLPSANTAAQITESEILNRRLSDASSEYLTDAIDTLQPEQYAALSKSDSPVMIVQGAAGAGKSLVALQRIQFILSPQSNIGTLTRPTPERIIMFGPSTAFLRYVREFLPRLGVPNLRQTTIASWMLEQFSPGSRISLKGGEESILNDLMNNTQRNRRLNESVDAYRFKGSMEMKRLLDKYVSRLKSNCLRNMRRQAIIIINRLSLDISVAEFRGMVDNAFSIRAELNAARNSLLNRLAELRRTTPLPVRRRDSPQAEIVAANRAEASRVLEDLGWPDYDFRREYVHLLSGADVLQNYSSRLDPIMANEVCGTMPRYSTGRSLSVTDLAAALYLDYSLNGFARENFQHVVVDEAQDISPLEMELLRMHSTNGNFTILGDLKQGLLPHRSIPNWNEFAKLFPKDSVAKPELRQAYRNTKQITSYSNRILKNLPKRNTRPPVPHGRSGARPFLVRSRSAADMHKAIADAVRELRELDEVRSIAVLTKWESTAKDIVKALKSERLSDIRRLEQEKDSTTETDIVVSPVLLTKGLEFDAVIVANAGKNNYNESDFDRMLLYLACTRACHHLHIHWHGTRSPIVPDTAGLRR